MTENKISPKDRDSIPLLSSGVLSAASLLLAQVQGGGDVKGSRSRAGETADLRGRASAEQGHMDWTQHAARSVFSVHRSLSVGRS